MKSVKAHVAIGVAIGLAVGAAAYLLFPRFSSDVSVPSLLLGDQPIGWLKALIVYPFPLTNTLVAAMLQNDSWVLTLMENACPSGAGSGIACVGIAGTLAIVGDALLYAAAGGLLGFVIGRFRHHSTPS